MKRTFIPILAVITGISSTTMVVRAESSLQISLHASAMESMEDRIETRRLSRLGLSVSNSISHLKDLRQNRSRTPLYTRRSSSSRAIVRRSVSSTSSSSVSLLANGSSLLERSNARRAERLGELPSPIKFQLIDSVNMERAKMALPPLRAQIDLETSAQRHAQDMKNRDYFSHENPNGLRSNDRIKATGYGIINAQECRCSYKVYLGENLAKGQTTIEQVIREWMESPSHRDAILSKDYDDIGVGIVDDIWVLNFGKIEITVGR